MVDAFTASSRAPRDPCRRLVVRLVAFALHAFAQHLAMAPDRLGALADSPLGRLLVRAPALHFTERAVALHLLLQDAERGVDVVVADEHLHDDPAPSCCRRCWEVGRALACGR